MKNLKEILTESQTQDKEIFNYGKSWASEHSENPLPVLERFISGMLEGVKENLKYIKEDPEKEMNSQALERLEKIYKEIL